MKLPRGPERLRAAERKCGPVSSECAPRFASPRETPAHIQTPPRQRRARPPPTGLSSRRGPAPHPEPPPRREKTAPTAVAPGQRAHLCALAGPNAAERAPTDPYTPAHPHQSEPAIAPPERDPPPRAAP